ncbi:hypothetical protein COX03_01740 [Candidatus Woesebacteria bacterium CG22_combo_CG10-13_8_21_14_all_39_10]|uniref:Uncharacterized protein n=3 Tax=Candidatus Woeseibacteriota TaxID=1752722 RepID=A0A2M7AQT8_9BACT|nr:MAG: hypothetical protein COX03_01740 [Candidatus Woesebacteria bacterium CG22_combo_CG10-13_8_21_14_all_39_10]PIU71949.1 MAG: hypothetical protein COS80_00475 [Candidatus Woesebacteria bacterium CG06_land_8_20_14_3_00_39_27]PIZ46223.1 MAG: hypothetical protein COY30_00560 [Candidatus Woesebacteria bacterium CG_4_10_14_0_2_um_filter_44_9]
MTKYQEYFQRMLKGNQELFDRFAKIHADYGLDEESHQEEFNKVGVEVLKVLREWEGKLCSQSEKAGFGSFTGNLAKKFQTEIKSRFPLIDHVGIIIKRFSLKKISF